MKTIFTLLIIVLFQPTFPTKLVLNSAKTEQLNVSEISDKITTVTLENIEIKNIDGTKLFIVNESIFILQRFQEDGISYSYVDKFDMKGNNLGRLETRDPVSNEQLRIIDMLYNNLDRSIFLVYSNGFGKFDQNGKMISFNKFEWGNGERSILHSFMYIFEGQIWFQKISHSTESLKLELVSASLNLQDRKIIKTIKSFPPDYHGILPSVSLSSSGKDLYVSFKTDNKIFRIYQGSISAVFELKINPPLKPEINAFPRQEVIGKYIKNGYWDNGIEHDFLYNLETKKTYNLKYEHDKNRFYISGIKDDLNNTGFFKFNPTNRADYIYYFRSRSANSGSKQADPKLANNILYLVKLK